MIRAIVAYLAVSAAAMVNESDDFLEVTTTTLPTANQTNLTMDDDGPKDDGSKDGGSKDDGLKDDGKPEKIVKVTGSAVLTVGDPTAFMEDDNAKIGVKKALAKSSGVDPSEVEVTFTLVDSPGRRLASHGGKSVQVDFTITKEVSEAEAATATSDLSTAMGSLTKESLAAEIMSEVQAAGSTYEVTVEDFQSEEPVTEDAPDAGKVKDESTTSRQSQICIFGALAALQIFA